MGVLCGNRAVGARSTRGPRAAALGHIGSRHAAAGGFPEDSLAVLDDTLADTLRVVNLPRLPRAPSLGWETATWTLDRAAIMGSRDLTLLELLESIPGVIPLRGAITALRRQRAPWASRRDVFGSS